MPQDGTQSIQRALHILKLFDDNCPQWELTALANAAALNKTTVFRILSALEAEGLVERTDDGNGYRLGSEMIALGGRAARANSLRNVSQPALQALSKASGETTTLEILRPDAGGTWSMLVIDEVLGRHLVGITQYIGSRLPIHATSTGKVLLAYMPPTERDALLPPTLEALTESTRTRAAFLTELETVRRDGYAIAHGELERGLVAIGAPIFDHNGNAQAAISLISPSVRMNTARIASLTADVLTTAAQISQRIGYRPPTSPSR